MTRREIKIFSIYEKVAEACYSLRDFCFKEKIEKKVCSELELCLTEALNNVIKHAYKEDPNKVIDITFTFDNSELTMMIEDSGSPRINIKEPELEYDPKDINSLPEGGMGLFIIKNLTDTSEYFTKEGKNIFLMKKIIQPVWN